MERRNYYDGTIDRLEPDIAAIDAGAYYASVAISQKRIADTLSRLENLIFGLTAMGGVVAIGVALGRLFV